MGVHLLPKQEGFAADQDLKTHAEVDHREQLPTEDGEFDAGLSATKMRPYIRSPDLRIPDKLQPRTISGIDTLNIDTPQKIEDIGIRNLPEDSQASEENLLRRRAVVGDGISVGSGNSFRDSSLPLSPISSTARPALSKYESISDPYTLPREIQTRPQMGKQLWTAVQKPFTKSSFNDTSNIQPITMIKARADQSNTKTRKPFQSLRNSASRILQDSQGRPPPTQTENDQYPSMLENYEVVLQPETRTISQDQLVAEVKEIYAGLVMVEAKCIEVDNKQATLAQSDSSAQPKLNNEQWQALLALRGTLLHENHDFFLASQHPSPSPALRRLASKFAIPARMWRHRIHSVLELLRHRLPASLDHMLAFIHLAYSIMALLYSTVPALQDTSIECIGDLGRCRMAIEDDDIRDRQVWTGVAKHWYSKASVKAPTTGRLYHHLAILARPSALQQLFYYAKSLCVVTPFTSTRESILTLFDPVLNDDNHPGQYRRPPLETYVKAHGLLYTNKTPEKFQHTVAKLSRTLLFNFHPGQFHPGRVTRKLFAKWTATPGFASKDHVHMRALNSTATNVHNEVCSIIPKETAGRGIKGKVNGHNIWAFGDTGAAQNIISARQAKKLRLKVVKSHRNLRMGNSKTVFSRGVVTFPWAFSESPDKITNVTAHVLDNFKYDILLCRSFLEDTKTMTDHVSRFVKGIFRRRPMMSFNLLGETSHRLNGFLEGDIRIEGLPDTGSTHNIINEAWAKTHGLPIQSGTQNCGRVYFPDRSSNLTTGRVHTTITLPGGNSIPIGFEVLPDCYVPVVLGADFVFDNKIFSDYADAIEEVEGVDCGSELLPMDYEQPLWYAKVGEKAKVLLQPKLRKNKKKGEPQPEKTSNDSAQQERQRRWNDQYQYGRAAKREEWDAELSLRESHELRQYPDWHPDPNRPLIRYGPMAGNVARSYSPVPLEDSSRHSYNCSMFGVDEAAVWQAERSG